MLVRGHAASPAERDSSQRGSRDWINNTLNLERTANVLWNTAEEDFEFRIFDSPWALEAAIREKAAQPKTSARLAAGFCWPWSVIWGPDLVYDADRNAWRGDPSKSHDRPVKRGGDAFIDLVKNTYRVLLSRGLKGCYVYFIDKATERFIRSRLEGEAREPMAAAAVPEPSAPAPPGDEPFRRLPPEEVRPFENCVPLYELEIAAGRFGDEALVDETAQDEEARRPQNFTWIELPEPFHPRRGLFVSRVVGESMNRRIPKRCLVSVSLGLEAD